MNAKDLFVFGVTFLLCTIVLHPGGLMDNYCVYLDDFCDPFFAVLPPRDYHCTNSMWLQMEIIGILEKLDPPPAYTFLLKRSCDFKVTIDNSTEFISFKDSPQFRIKLQGESISNGVEFLSKLSKKIESLQLEVDGFKCSLCDRCYSSFTSRKNTFTVGVLSME